MRQPATPVGGRAGGCTEAYAASAGNERRKGRPSRGAHDSTGASSRPSSGAGSSRMSGSKRHREDDTLDRGDLVAGKADFMLPCLIASLPLLAVPTCLRCLLGRSQPDGPRLAAATCQLLHQCYMLCVPLCGRHCSPSWAFFSMCVLLDSSQCCCNRHCSFTQQFDPPGCLSPSCCSRRCSSAWQQLAPSPVCLLAAGTVPLRQALLIGFANCLASRMPSHNGYKTLGDNSTLAQLHPLLCQTRS